MKLLVKCPKCGSTNITSTRAVLMDGNDSIKEWLEPPIRSGICEDCDTEITLGHLVKIDDDLMMVIDMDNVEIVKE